MRKFPVIVALVLIVVGGAYALVANLLPDNSRFPRVPTGDGTIGGAIARILGITDLANYLGDGTVANTNMLSGTTADKLLKSEDICLAPNVWIKTDATGKPVCGANGGMLATTIGTVNIINGTVTAYRADGTTKILTGSDPILEGDIIQTSPGANITIAFSDLSIIRLDGGSTVSLDSGVTTSGQSIAYAILNNGGLWGRVLTETGGYYIGSSDIVAGVRGTSVIATKGTIGGNVTPPTWDNYNHKYTLAAGIAGGLSMNIIHSTQSGTVIDCRSGSGILSFTGVNRFNMYAYNCDNLKTQVEYARTNGISIPSIGSLYMDSRIANNTVADLRYMVQLLKNGGLSPSKITRIQNEINVTKPSNATEKDDICPDDGAIRVYWDVFSGSIIGPCQSALAIADYTIGSANMYFSGGEAVNPSVLSSTPLKNPGDSITDDGYFGGLSCKENFFNQGNWITNWETRGTSSPQNLLSPGSLIANDYSRFFVENGISHDYTALYITNNTPQKCKGYIDGGQWDSFKYAGSLYGIKNQDLGSPTTGISITGTGYISYLPFLFPSRIGSLAGKTVTIELGSPVGSTMNCVSNKCYVANFGSEMYFIQKDSPSVGQYALFQKIGTATATPYPSPTSNNVTGKTQIVFTLSATIPSQFLLGNNTIPGTLPLMNTIKKVSIQ